MPARGEDATKAFVAFEWGEGEDETKIEYVPAKFDEYCEPRTQVIYERYRFNICKATRMLLKPGTGNGEPGTGNREPGTGNREPGTENRERGTQESGNERSAVFYIKIQNGGRENSPEEKRITQVAKYTVHLS